MAKFFEDFKAFAMKGNVMDMAIGVVVGGAFGKIVTSLVSDIIMPLIGSVTGGANFTEWKWTLKEAVAEKVDAAGTVIEAAKPAVTVNYGNFLQVTLDFLIIAFCIFLVIRMITKASESMKKKEEAPAPAAPAPKPDDVVLLEEIRDLLKKQQ